MRPTRVVLRRLATVLLVVASIAAAYWQGRSSGYRDGFDAASPQYRGLMVVRRTKGNPNSSGTSATWFNVRIPSEAARLGSEEAKLKAAGVEYYVSEAEIERSIRPRADLRHVNAHR